MQGVAARRSGQASRQGEYPAPQGGGGNDSAVASTDYSEPAAEIVGDYLYRQPQRRWRQTSPLADG